MKTGTVMCRFFFMPVIDLDPGKGWSESQNHCLRLKYHSMKPTITIIIPQIRK